MTINKFLGKTREEAIEKARKELGPNVVIMNVKEIKPKGLFRAFGSSTFEVTAALEEKESFVAPLSALMMHEKKNEKINLAADEELEIPKPLKTNIPEVPQQTAQIEGNLQQATKQQMENEHPRKSYFEEKAPTQEDSNIEKRLDNLSNMLEERFGGQKKGEISNSKASSEELNLIRMLYGTLIKNEVHERYVNQIMGEVEQLIRPGNSVDIILSNIYQKLILQFGQPGTIELTAKKPKVVFFIGPTGVGKTTSIAKIASRYKVEQERKVAFITADTYRIAATEQLRVYANILDAPMEIVYDADDLNKAVGKFADYDLIFVDTAGFSHKNTLQREDVGRLIHGLDSTYEKEVFLVLSATAKYEDLMDIVDTYHKISDYKLIFTKLDETSRYGNILNIRLYSKSNLSYVTDGQNVPDDIEVFDTQKIVKQLLGGN